MNQLDLINSNCCGDPELKSFAEFLERKLGERVAVRLHEMTSCTDFRVIPVELRERLVGQHIPSLPAVVLDGRVLFHGQLPNWMDGLTTITSHIEGEVS